MPDYSKLHRPTQDSPKAGAPDLGKLPPLRYYHQVKVKTANFVDAAEVLGLPDTPDYWQWGNKVAEPFPVFLNDRYGDCTCAAQAQEELAQSAKIGDPEVPADEAVFELYVATGDEQGLDETQGRYYEGVISYRKRVGMRQADGTLEKILGYAAVDPSNHEDVRASGYLFGGLHVGASLPQAAYYQLDYARQHNTRPVWSLSARLPDGTTNPGSWAAGSWGGHAVYCAAVGYKGPVIWTWGHKVQTTWTWWNRYVDECYCTISADWVREPAPSGFDKQGLLDLLATL